MTMSVEIRPLLFKPYRRNGLSERLLVGHYENNYGRGIAPAQRDRRGDDAARPKHLYCNPRGRRS